MYLMKSHIWDHGMGVLNIRGDGIGQRLTLIPKTWELRWYTQVLTEPMNGRITVPHVK